MDEKYSHGLLFTQALGLLHLGSAALSNQGVNFPPYPVISDIRRVNLLALVNAAGSQRELADKADLAPAQISQWITAAPNSKTGKPRVISDESARSLEAACEKPVGWMDHVHEPLQVLTVQDVPAAPKIEDALPVVLAALQQIPKRLHSETLERVGMWMRYGAESDQQRLLELLTRTSFEETSSSFAA